MEDGYESGQATLDHLVEDHVGLIEVLLWAGRLAVVYLAGHGWAGQSDSLRRALFIFDAGKWGSHEDLFGGRRGARQGDGAAGTTG